MNKILKSIAALAMAAVLLSACTPKSDNPAVSRFDKIKADGKLVVATSPDYAPFEFEDLRKTGQEAYVGADIDLARYIADKLGVQLVIEPMAFEAVVAAVNEGRADIALSGLNIDPERAKLAAASKVYYAGETQGLIALKENADSFKTIADLKGKKVAAQNGSVQLKIANEQLPDSQIELITTLGDGIMLLLNGKVDAVAVDTTTGIQFVENYDKLAISPLIFAYESEGFVAFAKTGETQLIEEVNKIIDEVLAGNLYTQWIATNQALSNELDTSASSASEPEALVPEGSSPAGDLVPADGPVEVPVLP